MRWKFCGAVASEAKEQHDKAEQLIRECMQRVALGTKGKNVSSSAMQTVAQPVLASLEELGFSLPC